MPDTSKLEKLNRELEKSEKKLRKAINDEKALQHQLKQLTRKERTHRLCTAYGATAVRANLLNNSRYQMIWADVIRFSGVHKRLCICYRNISLCIIADRFS